MPTTEIQRGLRRYRPPLWVWLVLVACLVGILWFRRPEAPDHAIMEVETLVLGFIAFMSWLGWHTFGSRLPRKARFAPATILGVAVAIAIATFRVEQTSGSLFPTLVTRWMVHFEWPAGSYLPTCSIQRRPHVDMLLDRVTVEETSDLVDLKTTTPNDFPRFLGVDGENRAPAVKLATDWQAHPPKQLWRQKIGAGWSAFAVVGPFAVTLEQRGDEELITCYEVATGKLRWSHVENARHETVLGGVGPRSTPTIHEGKVYTQGGTGIVCCLDGATGKLIWRHDLLAEHGFTQAESEKVVSWGRAGSPLIVDDKVVIPAGGGEGHCASLVAFDKNDGHLVWEGGKQQVGYSSPSLVELAGVRQILIVNDSSVAGHDPETGRELWNHPWPGDSSSKASASQPTPLGGDRLFLSKGYSQGCQLIKVLPEGDSWRVEELSPITPEMYTKMTNVAVRDGLVYGLSETILECFNPETMKRVWKAGRYGYGQVLLVDDLLLAQCESGEVALVRASPEAYKELARFQAIEGKTWNNPALSGQMLLVRNGEEAACYELPLAE